MSLGLSASVLAAPLLLINDTSSSHVLNGVLSTNSKDSLTAYEISSTTASFVIGAASAKTTTVAVPATTIVDDLSSELHPVAGALTYSSFSVIPADQIIVAQTAKPNTLVAPAHAVLPPPPPPPPPPSPKVTVNTVHYVAPVVNYSNMRTGQASWYSATPGTCANTWLPFGTLVRVTNLASGASTTCRVEDRGPYIGGRILDLSESSFSQIAGLGSGVINIKMQW
ncbi:MAG: hypothetical protein EPN30_08430 [Actinomycetota bacterium]|nr:MAG: hypothetical protein EPN30_08430 [Actinomycetota bacterium]